MTEPAAPRGVVVGVDGSPSSLSAVRWAAGEARLRGLPLTIVHVADAGATDESETVLAQARTAGLDAGLPDVDARRRTGRAVTELVEASSGAQLMVVGSRGRTGRLAGSVGVGMLHHARCPVAIVHGDVEPRKQPGRRPVLVGIDGSKASLAAAALAFEEAARRCVDLLALHVSKDAGKPGPYNRHIAEIGQEAEDFLLQALAGLTEQYPQVVVHPLVRFEDPARQLLVQSERSQLVVVGSHGRGAVTGTLLGSVSAAVAEGSRIPVIVAR
ncbi:universal stress protein [Mycolicibacterium sp.]|uniref:universal stress protein n=1 Tax=Mycolicibacterium sp. TaxID=2320850 RepID=UPI003D0F34A9